ncbi:hypothetical protein JDV09_12025 [Mycobacterium sp. Y57]|uniref:hypothetical protein n=1 Tax=Mycolicibacterium xanthum TaxID=2796469 RepID=UPI001C84154F|nr:hypothetical protein [Mycolicibacterium xanthum]MBX7432828.1 hypothetical protein [Mycolicibacterium xanthum]
MTANEHASAAADAMQADYFRGLLATLRSELEADLAKQVKRLTVSMTAGDMSAVSVLRRSIRSGEGDLRAIGRMVEALNGRFPGDHADRKLG